LYLKSLQIKFAARQLQINVVPEQGHVCEDSGHILLATTDAKADDASLFVPIGVVFQWTE